MEKKANLPTFGLRLGEAQTSPKALFWTLFHQNLMLNPTRISIVHQKVEKVLKIAINAEMVKFTRNNEYTRPPYSTCLTGMSNIH